ncbi:MAG TPA: 2,3-bisphosphoglycerate-independent phosphoglycerate mutase, partial [Gemmatimonadaceae bacterium]|nr:2,3-bisphosphoglycerate-independent phosphoglycerate mutase [Gemmatimonadaceae bacterium]
MANPPRARPVALVVLDGWGYRAESDGNAIALARTPTWDSLWNRGSRTLLEASGLRVGLPAGQMGNSEVGHLNLGAGRVVMQDLVRISSAIADGSFFSNPALVGPCRVKQGGTLHLLGLIGDGGVHAIDKHLEALLELARREKVERVAIHAFLDGRDTLPKSAYGYVQELLAFIAKTGSPARIATVAGRYYGMDRDRRWDRTELVYRALVEGAAAPASDPLEAIAKTYEAGITDEFMLPVVITADGEPVARMKDGDALICFNYRSDRMRQILRALIEPAFTEFDVSRRPKMGVTTLTAYDRSFNVAVAFDPTSMDRILAEVLSARGL